MSEYKSDQCPECGCEQFISYTLGIWMSSFCKEHDNSFLKGYFDGNYTPNDSGIKRICSGCLAHIDGTESIKQGKIVLAD